MGKSLQVEAGSEIVFKTGGASITLKSSGAIEIKGTSININGSKIAQKASVITLN